MDVDGQTEREMFAGLPELGISNGEDLKETLTNCTEPLKAIDQFQVTLLIYGAPFSKPCSVDYTLHTPGSAPQGVPHDVAFSTS